MNVENFTAAHVRHLFGYVLVLLERARATGRWSHYSQYPLPCKYCSGRLFLRFVCHFFGCCCGWRLGQNFEVSVDEFILLLYNWIFSRNTKILCLIQRFCTVVRFRAFIRCLYLTGMCGSVTAQIYRLICSITRLSVSPISFQYLLIDFDVNSPFLFDRLCFLSTCLYSHNLARLFKGRHYLPRLHFPLGLMISRY